VETLPAHCVPEQGGEDVDEHTHLGAVALLVCRERRGRAVDQAGAAARAGRRLVPRHLGARFGHGRLHLSSVRNADHPRVSMAAGETSPTSEAATRWAASAPATAGAAKEVPLQVANPPE